MGAHKPHKLWDLQTVMHTYTQRHVLYSLKMWHSHMTMTNYSMRLGSRRQTGTFFFLFFTMSVQRPLAIVPYQR
jgi:hypothetical protein